VPFAPGGATDAIARNLAERMKVSLGQPVIIENVTGAGGTIGTGRVARARPDGYTIGLGNDGTNVTNGATYSLQYDVVNDFEPIALVSTTPMLLLGKNGAVGQRSQWSHRVAEGQSVRSLLIGCHCNRSEGPVPEETACTKDTAG
jgi:tripartite-type tricarboxylate transporter receptor subunit TctC